MTDSDWIPGALPVVRPAAKLGTAKITDPCLEQPESPVAPKRSRPQSPLERLQEIVTLDLPPEERDAYLREYLQGLDTESLSLISAVLSTIDFDKSGVESINAKTVWRKL